MNFSLKETTARVANYNARQEAHGDELVSAADFKLEVDLANCELAMFHPTLRSLLYEREEGRLELEDGELTRLRFPALGYPLDWSGKVVGATVTFHNGVSERSHVVLKDVTISKFKFTPSEGGSVKVTFSVQFRPDERQAGKLSTMTGAIPVSIVPPEEQAPPA